MRERIFDLSRLCGGVMISIFGTAILFLADESFILDPSNEEKTFTAKSCPQLLVKIIC